MYNRRIRVVLNGLAVATMLFAQIVSASQACAAARDTPQMAFGDMHCADMPSQNICLQQYVSDFQNSGPNQVPVADVPKIAVLVITAVPVERPFKSRDYGTGTSHSPDPPSTILFCSFQI